ncbi:DUF6118 family protein [Caulobacter sp. NIBR2454]|uniref:DUF6118 family protein n=1 Tax=Caulobacter sp. NIBR2454 TaxID=3015996 RepID=UPI0022B63FA7|nr:DUF6118 family protein [Caulobacter sp. NIBR2454]
MAEDEALGAETHGVEPQDAAAEAFEALRAEVGQLRAVLEGLPTTAPDYSPTLAAIAQSLAAIEAHPALRLTPQDLASQVRQAADAAQQQGRRELANAVQRVDAAGTALERLAERQRTGREQVRQVAIMTAVGAVAGVIVWVCFSGPIARALPAGWSVPEKMAAATLNLDRWDAGARLMQSDNPQGWAQVAEGAKLERENRPALEDCWRAATRTGKAQRCNVTVKAASAEISR